MVIMTDYNEKNGFDVKGDWMMSEGESSDNWVNLVIIELKFNCIGVDFISGSFCEYGCYGQTELVYI